MADINTELHTIATSIYGSEMRSAIHDAIEAVNDDASLIDITSSTTGTFGTQGTTHFFGTYAIVKRLGVATLNIDIGIDYTVAYTRPSGTIIDNTGFLLFTLPDIYKLGSADGSCKIGLFPIADDRTNNDVPYIQINYATGDVRIYYGWDDVITETGSGYELIVNHTYISKLATQ